MRETVVAALDCRGSGTVPLSCIRLPFTAPILINYIISLRQVIDMLNNSLTGMSLSFILALLVFIGLGTSACRAAWSSLLGGPRRSLRPTEINEDDQDGTE